MLPIFDSQGAINADAVDHRSLLEAVFQADPSGVAVLVGPDLRFAYTNPAYRYVIPDPSANPIGSSYAQVWPQPGMQSNLVAIRETLRSGKPFQVASIQHQFRDGTQRVFTLQARRIQWGDQPAVLLILWDVTEQYRAQDQLQQANSRLRSVLASIAELYVVFDRDWRIIDLNRNAELHYFPLEPSGAMLGKNVWELLPQTVGGEFYRAMHQAMQTGQPVHVEAGSRVNGRWYEIYAYPRGEYLELYMRDISERKQWEAALEENSARLKRAEQIAHLGSWELDLRADQLTWSDEVYRIFGLEPQAFVATYPAFLEAVHPDDRAAVDEAYSSSIREGRAAYEIVHRIVRRNNGEVRFVHEKCEHIRDASGKIVRSIGMVQDITERKQTEAQRHVQTAALAATANGVVITDRNGTIEWVNPAFSTLTGYSLQEAIGKNPRDLVKSGVHSPDFYRSMWQTLLSGQVWRGEITNRNKEGHQYTEEMTITPVTNEQGEITHFIAVKQDISAALRWAAEDEIKRRLIEQREQERLQIARDLHDGPMQEILASVFSLQNVCYNLESQPQLVQELTVIQHNLNRQVEELRAYAGELRSPVLAKFGLEKAICSYLENFREKHPAIRIDFEAHQVGDLLPESARLPLYRIFQEAMQNMLKHSRASEGLVRFEKEDHRAALVIQDNGVGFSLPDDRLELARQGHLGLIGMRERAEAAGGSLNITSLPGSGTLLRVEIPL